MARQSREELNAMFARDLQSLQDERNAGRNESDEDT
jgi:hypothetical protein